MHLDTVRLQTCAIQRQVYAVMLYYDAACLETSAVRGQIDAVQDGLFCRNGGKGGVFGGASVTSDEAPDR